SVGGTKSLTVSKDVVFFNPRAAFPDDVRLLEFEHLLAVFTEDLTILFAADDDVVAAADGVEMAGLDARIHLALGLKKNLLLALEVLEADFVVPLAILACIGLDVALGFFVGQRVCRHMVGVIDAA